MDYTIIPRSLIYKDRTDLKDFGVQKPGTINNYLFTQMRKLTLLHCGNAKEIALQCLNNAYYICTLTQLDEFPDLCMDKYEKRLLEVKIPFPEDVYHASMALVCLLLAAYDDNYKQRDNFLIDSIHHWTSSNKWTGSNSRKSFDDIIKTCNTDRFTLPPTEFAPRDIIDAIENESENDLATGAEYICDALKCLDNPKNRMYGADMAIARMKDYLRKLYKDWGYDPATKTFSHSSGEILDYEFEARSNFFNETRLLKEAIEYIENHYPSQNEKSVEQSISVEDNQLQREEVPNLTASQFTDITPLQKRIEELEQLNAELENDNKELREQLENSTLRSSDEFEKMKADWEHDKVMKEAAENQLKRYEEALGPVEQLSKETKFSIAERIIFCSALLGCSLSEDDIIQKQMAKMIMRFSGDKWQSIRSTISEMNGKIAALIEVANTANKNKDAGECMAVWRREEKNYQGITNAALNVYNYLHAAVRGGTAGVKPHQCKQAMENIDHAYYLSERKLIKPTDKQPQGDEFALPPEEF